METRECDDKHTDDVGRVAAVFICARLPGHCLGSVVFWCIFVAEVSLGEGEESCFYVTAQTKNREYSSIYFFTFYVPVCLPFFFLSGGTMHPFAPLVYTGVCAGHKK